MEAESSSTCNDYEKAGTQYEASIEAAKAHKFIHEEAVACELAGRFFLERDQRQKSCMYFKRSIACYEKWGALVVAKRIRGVVEKEFGSEFEDPTDQVSSQDECPLDSLAAVELEEWTRGANSKKRQLD